MAKPLIDTVLLNARTIVADRRLRLRGTEAVTADRRRSRSSKASSARAARS
jgi:hypothetical protein